MIDLQIKLDNARKSFTSKDILTGEATVNANRDTSVQAIKLSCRGFAHLTAQQAGGKAVEEVYWHEDRVLFEPKIEGEKLLTGSHKYKFSFTLPDKHFPNLPASFAYKRDASGNGIKWLVRISVIYPKIKLRRSQTVEKPFLFFPQYNQNKFQHAIPHLVYEFDDKFKANTPQFLNRDKSLKSKIKASFSSHDPTKKDVSVNCTLITCKHGVSQGPFSSGIQLRMWASQKNFVLVDEVVITLVATQQLHFAATTEESKFRSEVCRIAPVDGEILPGDSKDPLTLAQLLKTHAGCSTLVIARNLPGTFSSKYFGQSYVLQVDLKVSSFYNRNMSRTLTFSQPVEVLHLWVNPGTTTQPTATFQQSFNAQMGPEGFVDDEDGLPAYPGLEDSPPGFMHEDITPTTSPMVLDNHGLRPLTSAVAPAASTMG